MNIYSRNVVAGVVGGTASVLGGGKFSNGAVMSAFDHLINSEGAGKGFYDRISDGDEISQMPRKGDR